jgi:hypothetical protein
MRLRFLLALGIATCADAQQDPMDLLRRVQAKVSDSINRLPRYMCTETIDRSIYQADSADRGSACDHGGARRRMHLMTSDRLRLDVAMAAAVEMYSWVGESRFNDRDLFDMVNEGAISTGSFAAFLTSIFRTEDASFTYDGDSTRDGRTLSEFGFQVPYEKSHYYFGQGIHRLITAWDGTFLADPRTADLVRLEVSTSQLPRETGACYATTALDYAQVRLKGIDFLLPRESVLKILNTRGGESENRTTFSNCHEFLGESKISFDPPPSVKMPEASHLEAAHAEPAIAIPAGLRFRVALMQGLDTATSAAGDPVKARLVTPIQNGPKVLAPAGSAVMARIVRLREFFGDATSVSVEVKLETVEVGGAAVRLIATPDTGATFQQQKGRGNLQKRIELGTLRGLEDRSASFVFKSVSLPYLIRSGLESSWITAAPPDKSPPRLPN